MPRDDTGDGDILVKFLPAQGIAVDFDLDFGEQIIGSVLESLESVGGKTENSLIGKFQINDAVFDPCPGGKWLSADGCGAHDIFR